ncbi:hypothetical protein BC834DRAFT_884130 [Gloeopeniophorella convolvens]|nr:hypothetical protein BC834DRAFT_884130 [Gloeopeniophorella convolvens]
MASPIASLPTRSITAEADSMPRLFTHWKPSLAAPPSPPRHTRITLLVCSCLDETVGEMLNLRI